MLRYLEGLGILMGMIFGAGVFTLPYSISKSGIYWGALLFGVALFFILFLHIRFGEVAAATEGKHRFTGYVRIWLGKKYEYVAVISTLFSTYGTLLIYGLLGGIFLSNLLPFLSQFWWSIIFWLAGGALMLLSIQKIGILNFYITVPIFIFILFLAWISAPHFKIENLSVGSSAYWFLPYGVFLFALSGFNAIPEVRDILRNHYLKNIKKVIIISILLCALFYAIFTLSALAVSGSKTTKDAVSGLGLVLGEKALIIGSLIGFLAVFSSFIALGTDLKNIFHYDYSFAFLKSWALTISVPPALFLLGATNFVRTTSMIGALGLGFAGIFIIAMSKKLRLKKMGKAGRYNEKKILPGALEITVAIGLIAGIFYEIINLF